MLGGLALLVAVVLLLRPGNPARSPSQIHIGYLENFPIDTVTPVILNVHFNDRGPLVVQDEPLPHDIFPLRIFVVSDARAGLLALYNRDPHAGCQVQWNEADERFEDPCHGSWYTRTGEYLYGPSPRGLDRFPIVAADDGELFIDLDGYQSGDQAEG